MWKRHSRLFGLSSGAGRAAECALRGALSRFTPAVCLATNRTACGMLRFYSAGRDRHSCVLAALARLSALAGSLRVGCLFAAISTGLPGTRGTGLAARRLCAFARAHCRCESFRREYAGAKCGSRTAAALDSPQGLAERQSALYAAGLCWCKYSSLQKAQVPQSAHPRAQNPGTRKDPSGSDLWPDGSGCITMTPIRSIGDLTGSDLWPGRSCNVARQQVEAALRPA